MAGLCHLSLVSGSTFYLLCFLDKQLNLSEPESFLFLLETDTVAHPPPRDPALRLLA